MAKFAFAFLLAIFVSTTCHAAGSAAGETQRAQNTAQQENTAAQDKGAKDAKKMAMMQAAIGAGLIAAGSAIPEQSLISAGIMMLMQAMMSMNASNKMGQSANLSSQYKDDLTKPGTSKFDTAANGGSNSIGAATLDPSELHNGQVGTMIDQFEKASGISANDFAASVAAGKDPFQTLKNSKLGLTADQLKKGMSEGQSMLASNPNAAKDMMKKLGIGEGKDTATGAAYAETGGAKSGSSSPSRSSLDDFLSGMKNKDEGFALKSGFENLSPEVRATLEKNGVTDKSLFQMVNRQYQKNMPMMFGLENKNNEVVHLPEGPGPQRGLASTPPTGI